MPHRTKYLLILSVVGLLAASLWLGLAPSSHAVSTTYYVAPTGSNSNPGTEASPFQTFVKGVSVLHPGDTLLVKNGTYTGGGFTSPPGGTSWSNPVTIKAYPGHHPVIRNDPALPGPILFIDTQYVILDGFVIDGQKGPDDPGEHAGGGVTNTVIHGHHIRIMNNEIMNAKVQGIAGCGNDGEILNNRIHDNGTNDFEHGIYCANERVLIEGNDIYRNAGWGITLFHEGIHSGKNIIVRNNLLHDNGRVGPRGSGIGVASGDGYLVYNNIVWNNQYGIDVRYNNPYNIKIFNNTIYSNRQNGIIVQGASDVMLRNNILYNNVGTPILDGGGNTGLVQSHNLTTNPLFVSPSTHDFHLTSGSPAIDAGTTLPEVPCDFDGNGRPAGSGYDIGAFEFGSSPGSGCSGGGSTPGPSPSPTPTPTPTPISKPLITLQAVPTTLTVPGQSSYMLWSALHATSCTASGAWSGPKPLMGTAAVAPSATSTYTLTCTGPGGTASASITITVGSTGHCHQYTSGSPIPPGFGVPWDVMNPASMLLKAQCTGIGATLQLGNNAPLTYIYKNAYVAKSGSSGWAPVSLIGPGLISNAWYPGQATAIVSMTDAELAQPSHYVGYVCRYSGGWKCGCRDQACTQSYWQIQQFKR